MRTLHLDVPRGLSVTLKPWNAACARALGDGEWRQVDLNFDFWRWLLDELDGDDRAQSGLYDRVIDLAHHAPDAAGEVLARCARVLARRGAACAAEPTLAGLRFPARATESVDALVAYARAAPDRSLLEPYFRHLCRRFMLLSGWSLLSLGVDSADGLVFAALLAAFVRRHDANIRICLTRHQYENYSLVHRLGELGEREGAALFTLFDAVVLYEEQAAAALRGLVAYFRTGDARTLTNVAVAADTGGMRLVPPDRTADEDLTPASVDPQYVADTGVPPDRLVYFAPLVRNACYYARCSFCVQNERYFVPQLYKHAAETTRALAAVEHLARVHGVTSFSFSDQALHPRLGARFAAAVVARGLRIAWCARMLFDPDALDDELLGALRAAGCREVLFGLESVHPPTLRAMRKELTGPFDQAAAFALLARAERCGLDVVLSLIFGFPTESDDEFEAATWRFAKAALERHANVTVILNRFALFRDTPIEREPQAFGIAQLCSPGGPFGGERDFVDLHGRDSRAPHPREAAYRAGLAAAMQTRGDGARAPAPQSAALLAYVNYSSIGLGARWRTAAYVGARPAGVTDGVFVAAEGGERRDVLVLGSNAYIGQNLARVVDPRRLLLSSRAPRNPVVAALDAPLLRADLVRGAGELAAIASPGAAPREVYVVARPSDGAFEADALFAAWLQSLLHAWAATGTLRRVVLLSTQLVYATPFDDMPLSSATPVAPVAPYEYFKASLERFVQYLTERFALRGEVVRLPLAYGGAITPAQRRDQLIYAWADALRAGARWEFAAEADERWGNSWVYTPDLVAALTRSAEGTGRYWVRQPVSGDFTYAGMQDAIAERAVTNRPQSRAQLRLPRSRFLLRDEEGLAPRSLTELLVADEMHDADGRASGGASARRLPVIHTPSR